MKSKVFALSIAAAFSLSGLVLAEDTEVKEVPVVAAEQAAPADQNAAPVVAQEEAAEAPAVADKDVAAEAPAAVTQEAIPAVPAAEEPATEQK